MPNLRLLIPTLQNCSSPLSPPLAFSIPVNAITSYLDAQGRNIWIYTCFLPFPHLLLLTYQWGWLILPTKSMFRIFLLCLISMVVTHSSAHWMCSSPQGFFQCLGTALCASWLRKAWSHCLGHSNVSTSVMAPMTHLSKTGLSLPVAAILCLRNDFSPFIVFP